MYFLNTEKAIRDLQTGVIDERASLKYLVGLVIITGIGVPSSVNEATKAQGWFFEILTFIVGLAALIIAIRKAYVINQPSQKAFLPRFVVLHFVASVKALLITAGVYLLLSLPIIGTPFFMIREDGSVSMSSGIVLALLAQFALDLVCNIGGIILWYFLFINSFKTLNQEESQHVSAPYP